ncbi:TlpA family protein disulfide reductase [bacterium]|nr:TlpA family protein disulfide reductase [bacterium]
MKYACLAIIALLMALSASSASAAKRDFLTTVGEPIPQFKAETVAGDDFVSRAGAQATLIHVFACESDHCKDSLKALEEFLWVPLQEKGLRVVGVARDATPDEARQYAADYGLTFPIVPDPDRTIAELFAEDGVGVPRTIILDSAGNVVYQHAGFRTGREAEFRLVAESVLAGEGIPESLTKSKRLAASGEDQYARDMIGEKAPELIVETWVNKPPEDVEGKFILMEFWATWCGPCVASMPHLEELSKSHKDSLVIYSVSDEPLDRVKPFVEKKGFTYPIGIDERARTKSELEITAIPQAFLVNPEGIVVWQGHPMTLAQDGVLDDLLAGKTPQE